MSEIAATPNELVPASRNLPAPLSALGKSDAFAKLTDIARQPAIAKAMPMLGLLGVLVAAAMAWAFLHTGPQRNLFSGLGDADKAAVVQALDTAGIKYTVDNDTGALTVPEESYYRAKMLLAQQGLPKAAPDGDTLISSLPMGASRAVEGARLQQAQEMDLARTIEAIDAVQSAKVHIAGDQPSVFLRDDQKAQASVMLTLNQGRSLSDSQVQAIIHLVASSVAGLTPDGVSVVDQAGRLLSAQNSDGQDATDRQVLIQQKVEDRYRQSLGSLLSPIVGDGNFTAEVHADMDFTEAASTTESYPKDGAMIATEQGQWTNDPTGGANAPATGIPGAISNTAPAPAKPAATANGQPTPAGPQAPGTAPGQAAAAAQAKTNETYNRSYQLGHQVSVTKNQVGTVHRLTVAVALRQPAGGKPLTAQQQQQIQDLVKGAVGFDQARGDSVSVSQQTFVAVDAAAAAAPKWYEGAWVMTMARNLTALAVAAIIVFGIGRPMLKRRATVVDQKIANKSKERAQVGKEIAAMLSTQQAEAAAASPAGAVTLDMIESAPGYAARAALIRNFVRQDPDRAALVVRDLIRADMPKAEAANA
ncbi:flagellar basal-body MS-ring/collar protein FliF [Sphingomonas abietis]|uniref:Flagellar M-ring protein n=1 Tax=Sphingomonas abietis TaxID=3012344 RepID=A0ABY7NKR2_9SPHN|nr:flagellar basal-body MS-ring/collar protein FliF [Sphingomonas abietis]WBO22119.1 flagellar basal-body MS-ring/collar protein FliF [Sphingomonas abietis]